MRQTTRFYCALVSMAVLATTPLPGAAQSERKGPGIPNSRLCGTDQRDPGLRVCNCGSEDRWAAVMSWVYDREDWVRRGWFQLKQGQCRILDYPDANRVYLHVSGYSFDSRSVTKCVSSPDGFERTEAMRCAANDVDVNFYELQDDTGSIFIRLN